MSVEVLLAQRLQLCSPCRTTQDTARPSAANRNGTWPQLPLVSKPDMFLGASHAIGNMMSQHWLPSCECCNSRSILAGLRKSEMWCCARGSGWCGLRLLLLHAVPPAQSPAVLGLHDSMLPQRLCYYTMRNSSDDVQARSAIVPGLTTSYSIRFQSPGCTVTAVVPHMGSVGTVMSLMVSCDSYALSASPSDGVSRAVTSL